METPATQYIDSLLKSLHERALDKTDKESIRAARTILAYDIWHKRAAIYEKRCEILNERTQRLPPPNQRNSSAHSAISAVNDDFVPTKGDPRKKKPFGAQLSPGDTDPQTGWVVPEEHICQIRKDAPENHVMAHCMLPGYKTKADLERAVYTFIDRDNRIYNELKSAQSELNVFRSERLGSITLEKREELLAGRFERNNKRRTTYGTPTFLAELPQLTPELLATKPVPPLEELFSVPNTYPDREGAGSSPSTPLSPTSTSLVSPHNSSSSSAPPPCPSVNSVVSESLPSSAHSASSAVKEVLSEKAAARRAAGEHSLLPITPRLNHPTPFTRRAKPP